MVYVHTVSWCRDWSVPLGYGVVLCLYGGVGFDLVLSDVVWFLCLIRLVHVRCCEVW